jgi:RNA polymerase-binding transcription factor DksA
MDARRRARFRRSLDGRRLDAERRLAAIAADRTVLTEARDGATSDDEHDPEGVTLAEEWSRLEGMRGGLERELDQIRDAVARLEAGDYGVCVVCGTDIPVERLEVRPFTDHCVSCAA